MLFSVNVIKVEFENGGDIKYAIFGSCLMIPKEFPTSAGRILWRLVKCQSL